jgi:hypothetical protein
MKLKNNISAPKTYKKKAPVLAGTMARKGTALLYGRLFMLPGTGNGGNAFFLGH